MRVMVRVMVRVMKMFRMNGEDDKNDENGGDNEDDGYVCFNFSFCSLLQAGEGTFRLTSKLAKNAWVNLKQSFLVYTGDNAPLHLVISP